MVGPLADASRKKAGPDGTLGASYLRAPYLRRFRGHLDAGLQDGDREARVGARAEPEAEGRVRIFHLQLLHQLVQIGHPRQ